MVFNTRTPGPTIRVLAWYDGNLLCDFQATDDRSILANMEKQPRLEALFGAALESAAPTAAPACALKAA